MPELAMVSHATLIRAANEVDLSSLVRIYNHYVEHEAATFDLEPHTLLSRLPWFRQFSESGPHRIFTAEVEGVAVGYACSTKFKDRPAYATSIETSVYVAPDCRGRGIGRLLYGALFKALMGEDLHRAFAGVTQPNEASMRLHHSAGFVETGIFREAGRKFGRFWDVVWLARDMP